MSQHFDFLCSVEKTRKSTYAPGRVNLSDANCAEWAIFDNRRSNKDSRLVGTTVPVGLGGNALDRRAPREPVENEPACLVSRSWPATSFESFGG